MWAGIAYGLDGPGIESRWRRNFPHLSRPALRPTQTPVQWVQGLSRHYATAGLTLWIEQRFLWIQNSREMTLTTLLPCNTEVMN